MILRDEKGQTRIFYHGTTALVDKAGNLAEFNPKMTKDGGVHFGDFPQAHMRNRDHIVPVTLDFERTKRCIDRGGGWKEEIRKAKKQRYDSIVYLNRFEGVPNMAVRRLGDLGLDWYNDVGRWPDSKFRRYVPEARDSYIAFYPEQIKRAEKPRELYEANMATLLKEKKGMHEMLADEEKLRKRLKIKPLMFSGLAGVR
jgi:hypothetical protein